MEGVRGGGGGIRVSGARRVEVGGGGWGGRECV